MEHGKLSIIIGLLIQVYPVILRGMQKFPGTEFGKLWRQEKMALTCYWK